MRKRFFLCLQSKKAPNFSACRRAFASGGACGGPLDRHRRPPPGHTYLSTPRGRAGPERPPGEGQLRNRPHKFRNRTTNCEQWRNLAAKGPLPLRGPRLFIAADSTIRVGFERRSRIRTRCRSSCKSDCSKRITHRRLATWPTLLRKNIRPTQIDSNRRER